MFSQPRTVRRLVTALFASLVASAMMTPSSSASVDDQFRPSQNRSDAVVLRPTAQEKAEVPPMSPRGDAGNVVDVAFVYPADLVTQADVGGIAGLRTRFNGAINGANAAFANSGIPLLLRYVGDRQVAAATTTDLDTMYKQLRKAGDGVYDEAQALREETHADLVTLWVSGSPPPVGGSCGLGALGGIQPAYDAEYAAWSVMFYSLCAGKILTFEHEIGHNLSGDHDATAAFPPLDGKPYARGYTDPANKFITVMSYYDACKQAQVTCLPIPYFSSPTNKTPQGLAVGNAQTDNTRAITEQAPAVANYRQSQIYPVAPVIRGKQNRGKTLVATTPGWTPGNVTFTFQWTANGVPIPGATAAKLRLRKFFVGKSIAVTVTGAAPYYAPVAAGSAATGLIGKKLFKKTHRPRIRGVARPGRVLHAHVKAWKPRKKVSYRFKWFRNGKKIKGAKGRNYRVSRKDRGKKITVRVKGKRRGFESQTRKSRKVKVRRR